MRLTAAILLLSVPAGAQIIRHPPVRTVSALGTCTDGSPKLVYVTDGASATDCATGSGTTEVLCQCEDGAWAAASSGIGGSTGAADDALLCADGTGGATLQACNAASAFGSTILRLGGGSADPEIRAIESGGLGAIALYDTSSGGLTRLWAVDFWGRVHKFGDYDPPAGECYGSGSTGYCAFNSTFTLNFTDGDYSGARDVILSRGSAGVLRVDDALRLDCVATAPVACSSGTSGTLYCDSTSSPDSICACDGSSYLDIAHPSSPGDCT